MLKKLTLKDVKKYIESSGNCPYCNSHQIEGGSIEVDSSYAWQKIRCYDCDSRWQDIYQLKSILVEDKDGFFIEIKE